MTDYAQMGRDSGKALRIAVVSRIYTPEPSAGSMRLQALVDELVGRGHQVTVVTTKPPKSIVASDHNAPEEIRRWPVLRDRAGYVRGYLQYLSYDVPLFFRVLFAKRPDVYVVEPPPTTGAVMRVAAWLKRRPYVYYAADIWSDAAQLTGAAGWVVKAVRLVEKYVLNGAAQNLVVTDGVDQRVGTLAPRASTATVGHGVDTELFSPDGPGVDAPADIVYVGTMSEWHGASVAVEALAEVMQSDDDVTAVFIGQGADKDTMERAVKEHGLAARIRFLAPVPSADAARWLRSARVALATLKPGGVYDFAVPTKLYAAMAAGTPIAYAGPQMLQSLVAEHDLGEAAAFDVNEYAQAIRRLLARSDGRPNRRLVEWAQANVSARAVAARAADATVSVAGARTGVRGAA